MHNGIAWSIVQRMMIDAPSFETNNDEDEIILDENNSGDILNYVNNMM